jgi:hypothetical protein
MKFNFLAADSYQAPTFNPELSSLGDARSPGSLGTCFDLPESGHSIRP